MPVGMYRRYVGTYVGRYVGMYIGRYVGRYVCTYVCTVGLAQYVPCREDKSVLLIRYSDYQDRLTVHMHVLYA